ncbi:MAG: aminoglycoside phosphotransferase family protein [Paracoccaceae bacterium]
MWSTFLPTDLDVSAMAAWQRMIELAHLPADGWSMKRLARRDDEKISRISLLAAHEDGAKFTFKFQIRPSNTDEMVRQFEWNQRLHSEFPKSDEIGTLEPVLLDEEGHASLTKYIEGSTLSSAARKLGDDKEAQNELLRRTGLWLDAFHRLQVDEHRVFHPKYTVGFYQGIRNDILAGRTHIANRELFLRGIDHLETIAPQYENRQTVSAVQHGDFHSRNVVVSDQKIIGIDLTSTKPGPVGYDIARLLVDFTGVTGRVSDAKPGMPVPQDIIDAFFDGYTLVGPDDPGFGILQFARVLGDLLLVPPKSLHRSAGKTRTLKRLRPVAKNAFQTKSRPNVHVLLTENSLERDRSGKHLFINTLRDVAETSGMNIVTDKDTADRRAILKPKDLSLVHMQDPVSDRGLTFRKLYSEAFWRVEDSGARWDWSLAQAKFDPASVDRHEAQAFFDLWQDHLHGSKAKSATKDGFVYMPLQGRLLEHRSFQSTSPVDMIRHTLAQCDLPIQATLHPNETYTQAEHDALAVLANEHPRFQVVERSMEDALAACDFVVTENSSAGFHAFFYGKVSILFARIEFHHICASVPRSGIAGAFEEARALIPDFAAYIYWFWKLNGIDLESTDASDQLRHALLQYKWPV